MDLSKLSEGMIIKNYKELCGLLGVEYCNGGNKRKKQLDNLSGYVSFTQEKHSYIINKIYETRVISKKERQDNYINNIESLILSIMYCSENERTVISKTKLLRTMSLINENYNHGRNRIDKLSNYLNIDGRLISEWYDSTSGMITRNLDKVFSRLRSNAIAMTSTVTMVCEAIPNDNTIQRNVIVDEYDEEFVDYKVDTKCRLNFREATEYEKKYILDSEKYAFIALGVSNRQEIISLGKESEFKKIVNEKLLREIGVIFYYDAYEIIYNQNSLEHYMSDKIFKELSDESNLTLKEKLIDNIYKKQQRCIEKFGEHESDESSFSRKDNIYIEYNKLLNDVLIDKNSADILGELKITKKNKDNNSNILKYKKNF